MKIIGLVIKKGSEFGENAHHMMFASQDEAAIHFVMRNNPRTHVDNRERGSYIYKTKSGKYFYLNESAGKHEHLIKHAIFDYVFGFIFGDKTKRFKVEKFLPVAFVHTHPSCRCHAGDTFSDQDKVLTRMPGISTVYLGSPSGRLYAYDGKSKAIRIISTNLPSTQFKFPNADT